MSQAFYIHFSSNIIFSTTLGIGMIELFLNTDIFQHLKVTTIKLVAIVYLLLTMGQVLDIRFLFNFIISTTIGIGIISVIKKKKKTAR